MKKRKRLPSHDELIETAKMLAYQASRRNQAIAIAGGLAMQVWGSPRLTADLDIIALDLLGHSGEPLLFGGIRFMTRKGTSGVEVPVDIIVRADEFRDLYTGALAAAVVVDDLPPVVDPEFLVAMKMVAGRTKDESDVRYLVLLEDFDVDRADNIVRAHLGPYAVRELHSIVIEAKWRAEQGDT